MLDDNNKDLKEDNNKGFWNRKNKILLLIEGVCVITVLCTAAFDMINMKSRNLEIEAAASNITDDLQIKNEDSLIEVTEEKAVEVEENEVSKNVLDIEETKLNNQKTNNIKAIVEQNFSAINGGYSFAFKDLKSNEVISINNEKSASASVIKIFIMIEAFDQIQNNQLNLQDILILKDSDKVGGAGVIQGYQTGKQLTIEELIKLMMSKSDNTATNMIIDKVGMANINNKIKQLGCKNTELNRKMMDSTAIQKGIDNYTSVDDLILTFTKLYNGQCISPAYDKIMIDIMKANENTTKICGSLSSNIKVAHKTGELTGVQNDAGIVFAGDNAYIVCFMTKNGSEQAQIGAIAKASKEIYDITMAN